MINRHATGSTGIKAQHLHPFLPGPGKSWRTRAVTVAAATAMLAMLAALNGCATGGSGSGHGSSDANDGSDGSGNPQDPLERLNRATFAFNDALDRTVATPLAKGYNRVVPGPVRTGVSNFFSNLGDVVIMINSFAQGRVADGVSDVMRIAVNTVLGIGGLIDIASPAGLEKHDQDFGLTLGHYGVPPGPYLVLPLFGPSTFRDTANVVGDVWAAPLGYLPPGERNPLFVTNFISTRARYLGATDLLSAAALDKYAFVRDAYLGRRRSQLQGDQEESLPDYENDPGPGGGGAAPGR
jgi:phospholipid-binding lipoprotein MlaA